jgi:DNA-binding SARP family transcriptional activator/predicted ATPase
MSRLTVSLLGPFQATLDGRPLDNFRTSKVQALLIYLLLHALEHADQGVGREGAMTLLWPEMPRKSAQVNMRQTLYHLRQAIPDVDDKNGEPVPFILSNRQTVQVNPAARYELDVASFLSLVNEGDREQLAAAVELYRGDFLADFYLEDSSEFETWAARWRSRLRRQALETLDQLMDGELARRQLREAAAYARRALAIDELRESAHRGLIKALGQMGKRAAALKQYERCRRLLERELSVAPSEETEAIAADIRRHDKRGKRETRLPLPANPLIGREGELEDLATLLGDRARLVSIVGPGGMGKTHLALELARSLTDGDEGGRAEDTSVLEQALYVDMAPLAEAADLVTAVAGALGLAFNADDRGEGLKQRVLDVLADRNLLLLLDNFEHLMEAAPLLSEILKAAPAVKLLATTRERLKLRAEHAFPIGGLTYSAWTTPVEASRDPAAQLFLYHARRARPAFRLRREHLQPLHEILRLTGGMPLALILAAGWVKVLTLQQIAAEIGRSLKFLEATERDVPPRQRSMQAVFGATWGRLSKRQKRIFPALSVFRGGFTLSAAEEVAGATARDLLLLVDQSLLVRREGGRFLIHELLRQFAGKQLEETGDSEGTLQKHSTYYLQWLADLLPDIKGSSQLDIVEAINEEFYNARAAWRYACGAGYGENFSEAARCLFLFARIRSRYFAVIDLFQMARLSKMEMEPAAYAYVTAGWQSLSFDAGLPDQALTAVPELQACLEGLSDPFCAAYCHLLMYALPGSAPTPVAIDFMESANAVFQAEEEPFYAALAHEKLAWARYVNGQPGQALHTLRLGLAVAEPMGDYYATSILLRSLGALIWMVEGLSEEAVRCYREGAELQREMEAWIPYAHSLSEVATIPVWREGDLVKGLPLLEEALAIAKEQKIPSTTGHVLAELTTHRLIEGRYEEALALTYDVQALCADHEATWLWSRFQRGIAFLGLRDIEQAIECMEESLARMVEQDWSGMLRVLLAFPGVVLAELGEHEKAAELLAFGLSDPYTSGRLKVDPLIQRTRSQLKQTLGEETFAAAWERGEQLVALEAATDVLKRWDQQE